MQNSLRSEQRQVEPAVGALRREARRTTGSRRLILTLMVVAAGPGLGGRAAEAQSPAASQCPTMFFLSGQLAQNQSFEVPGADGAQTCWQNGDPVPPPSAAAGWTMHSSNDADTVCSALVPTSVPGPGGQRMLLFRAGGNEGGVFQSVTVPPGTTYMFSVWVFVRRGQVAIQSSAGVGGPVAWSTKRGEWEQLRVCNNSLFGVDTLVIYNQDPNGGEFAIDRAELRQIPTLE